MASWSITGLFLALTPSVITGVLHIAQGAAGGLEIAALFLADRGIGRGGGSCLAPCGGQAGHSQQHPFPPRLPVAWPPICRDEALSLRSPSSGPLPWRGRQMRGIVAVCPLVVLRAPQLESGLCNRVTSWR
jgi:hypothetical protein